MLRFACLVSLVACATPVTPKPAPAPLANVQPTTTYRMRPLERVPGPEGRHSASHTYTDVTGTLELTGDRARYTMNISAQTGYVRCPEPMTEQWPHRQACIPASQGGGTSQTSRQTFAIDGTATRRDGALVIVFAKGKPDQELTLACTEGGGVLLCKPNPPHTFHVLARVGEVGFERVRAETPPRSAITARQ
jgi:hypothetical protein